MKHSGIPHKNICKKIGYKNFDRCYIAIQNSYFIRRVVLVNDVIHPDFDPANRKPAGAALEGGLSADRKVNF